MARSALAYPCSDGQQTGIPTQSTAAQEMRRFTAVLCHPACMAKQRRSCTEPLHPEKAALILAGAAVDIEWVAARTVKKLRQLEAGDAGEKLIGATRRAAIALEEAANRLRGEGMLGPPDMIGDSSPEPRLPR